MARKCATLGCQGRLREVRGGEAGDRIVVKVKAEEGEKIEYRVVHVVPGTIQEVCRECGELAGTNRYL